MNIPKMDELEVNWDDSFHKLIQKKLPQWHKIPYDTNHII